MVAQPWFKKIFRASEALEDNRAMLPAGTPLSLPVKVQDVGSYGTEIYAGYIYEEYLSALQGYRRAYEFDKMRRGDYQVKMILSAVKNPIRSAKWIVQPGDDSKEAQDDAKLIEHILFNDLGKTWRKILSEILTVLEFGFSPFEITNKIGVHPEFGPYLGVRLGYRSPKTIHRFNVNPEDGSLVSISQFANGDLNKTVDIPAHWVMLFNLDQEGANYEGTSMLRPCYGAWRRKDVYLKLNAVGIEKFAVPTPIVEVPDAKVYQTEYDNMIQALERYTQHHANYLTHPKGWTLNLQSNTYDPQKVETSIDNEDKRMTKAFLANFLELGMSGTGAYALSNDLSDFFLSGIEYIADEIKEPFNTQLIPYLVKLNRGERKVYPKLMTSGISDKTGKEFAEMLKLFIDGKVVVPDDKLETFVRKQSNLPEKSDEGQRDITPKPAFSLAEKVRNALKLSEK